MRLPRELYLLGLCLVAACDPAVHAAGRVRAPSGAPIADASVSLVVNDEVRVGVAWTDTSGRFAITRFGSRKPPFALRVCSAGYQTVVRQFTSLDALRDSIDLILEPTGPSPRLSTAAPGCPQPLRPAA